MMTALLILISLATLTAAAAAMSLRNLIHSVLLLIGSWLGVAAFYLWAGAEFVAFAQLLVYVGAVSMVVLFAVLLTRRSRTDVAVAPDSLGRAFWAVLAAAAVLCVLAYGVLKTNLPTGAAPSAKVTVRDLGNLLMGPHAAALVVIGLILTVAMLGGVVIAATDAPSRKEDAP